LEIGKLTLSFVTADLLSFKIAFFRLKDVEAESPNNAG
jgi:hypothetical protein